MASELDISQSENILDVEKIIDQFFKEAKYTRITELCSIMQKHGSDKGGVNNTHNYTTLYLDLFSHLRDKPINIFEMGLGTNNPNIPSTMGVNGKPCASHFGWMEFFPNAQVYGGDIDQNILYQRDRLKTFYCDQTSEESIKELFFEGELKDVQFDIIIDDALHKFEANLTMLTHTINKLKSGGIYVVEDLDHNTRDRFNLMLSHLKSDLNLSFIKIVNIPHTVNPYDNVLLIVIKN